MVGVQGLESRVFFGRGFRFWGLGSGLSLYAVGSLQQ